MTTTSPESIAIGGDWGKKQIIGSSPVGWRTVSTTNETQSIPVYREAGLGVPLLIQKRSKPEVVR